MSANRAALRKILNSKIIIAPGVYDGLSARLADSAGFEALYLSGYGVSASQLAKPDNGFLTLPDMEARIQSLCEAISTPLIADADTGFDDIGATVQAYEKAGAAGIQIEDQQVPKICGHIPCREVVSRDEAVAKITEAVAARQDDDFLIVARTDAREQNGLDEAIERGRLFAAAGADICLSSRRKAKKNFAKSEPLRAICPCLPIWSKAVAVRSSPARNWLRWASASSFIRSLRWRRQPLR